MLVLMALAAVEGWKPTAHTILNGRFPVLHAYSRNGVSRGGKRGGRSGPKPAERVTTEVVHDGTIPPILERAKSGHLVGANVVFSAGEVDYGDGSGEARRVSDKHFFSSKGWAMLSPPPSGSLLERLGVEATQPSRIQVAAWPEIRAGHHAILADQTGSGKVRDGRALPCLSCTAPF